MLNQLGLGRPDLRAWAMYDWANSAFQTTIIAAVFPIYFASVVAADLPEAERTANFAWATTIAIVIVALVSPGEADRAAARAIVGGERFLEVHLSAPVETCESRDDEGLYRRARAGDIERFTGVSAPYEPPRAAELVLPTHEISVDDSVSRLVDLLATHGVLRR